MDTAITILIFGIVGLSAVACVAALLLAPRAPRGARPQGTDAPPGDAPPVDETWQEARALVEVRNARRRRRGEPESDPDVEAAEILRALEREAG